MVKNNKSIFNTQASKYESINIALFKNIIIGSITSDKSSTLGKIF